MGWLYSDQSMSTLAIRHLSEVTEKIPTHFKAIFLQAKEHYKLGEQSTASQLIDKGLQICREIHNEEYTHHFSILKIKRKYSIGRIKKSFKKESYTLRKKNYGNMLSNTPNYLPQNVDN